MGWLLPLINGNPKCLKNSFKGLYQPTKLFLRANQDIYRFSETSLTFITLCISNSPSSHEAFSISKLIIFNRHAPDHSLFNRVRDTDRTLFISYTLLTGLVMRQYVKWRDGELYNSLTPPPWPLSSILQRGPHSLPIWALPNRRSERRNWLPYTPSSPPLPFYPIPSPLPYPLPLLPYPIPYTVPLPLYRTLHIYLTPFPLPYPIPTTVSPLPSTVPRFLQSPLPYPPIVTHSSLPYPFPSSVSPSLLPYPIFHYRTPSLLTYPFLLLWFLFSLEFPLLLHRERRGHQTTVATLKDSIYNFFYLQISSRHISVLTAH